MSTVKTMKHLAAFDASLSVVHTSAEKLAAVAVLRRELMGDRYMAIQIERVLSSSSTKEERTHSLIDLLTAFGVGTIVEGRLV